MIVFVVPYVKNIRLGGAVGERLTTEDTGSSLALKRTITRALYWRRVGAWVVVHSLSVPVGMKYMGLL